MKIAVFSRSTTEHFISGGMETHLKNLVEGLEEAGHIITVFTTSYPTGDKNEINLQNVVLNNNGVEYVYIAGTTPGLAPLNSWENLFFKMGLLKRCMEGEKNYFLESRDWFFRRHSQQNFDCIISQSTSGYGLLKEVDLPPIYAVIHGTIKTEIKNRRKTIKTLKNAIRFYVVDLPKWIWEKSNRNEAFFSKCSKIISVNSLLTDAFKIEYPHFGNKIETINNGVDTEIFKPGTSKFSYFTVLYVGRLDIEKGADLVIDATKLLYNEGIPIKVKIIGGGAYEKPLKNMARIDNLMDNEVEFVGQVNNSDLPDYYRQSHVFVLPTRREEGHPMTVSEAFCCELPVICTRKGGLSSLISDGENGIFIDESAKSLAGAIKYLFENRDVLARMGEKAYAKGIKDFSRKTMISNYLSVLKSNNL